MLSQFWNSAKPTLKLWAEACILPLLGFAPLFLKMGMEDEIGPFAHHHSINSLTMFLGVYGLSIGLMVLYVRQVSIMRRLDKLEK